MPLRVLLRYWLHWFHKGSKLGLRRRVQGLGETNGLGGTCCESNCNALGFYSLEFRYLEFKPWAEAFFLTW